VALKSRRFYLVVQKVAVKNTKIDLGAYGYALFWHMGLRNGMDLMDAMDIIDRHRQLKREFNNELLKG
jgi:hypothetical protein